MKKIILTLMFIMMGVPAIAQEKLEVGDSWLKPIQAEYVCMVNNQKYDAPQIAVEVEGKTYYGCCSMCKARLEKDTAIRSAIDPVSSNAVNKAEATIGAGPNGKVYYFENIENFQTFADAPIPNLEKE